MKKYSTEGEFLVTYTTYGVHTGYCFSTEKIPAKNILTSGEFSEYWITKILKEELETKYQCTVAIINWWYQDNINF